MLCIPCAHTSHTCECALACVLMLAIPKLTDGRVVVVVVVVVVAGGGGGG
jgi:hypothetical protein